LKSFFALFITLGLYGCTGASPTGHIPAQEASSTPVVSPTKPEDKWLVLSSTNELNGTKNLSLSNSDQIFVRCSPKLEGYIVPPLTNLGHSLEPENGHRQHVRYRLDDGPIRDDSWGISDDYEALFMPRAVIMKLPLAKSIVVEYQPEYTVRKSHKFSLEGLAEAETKVGCIGMAKTQK
jgi:hypothetical protein